MGKGGAFIRDGVTNGGNTVYIYIYIKKSKKENKTYFGEQAKLPISTSNKHEIHWTFGTAKEHKFMRLRNHIQC